MTAALDHEALSEVALTCATEEEGVVTIARERSPATEKSFL